MSAQKSLAAEPAAPTSAARDAAEKVRTAIDSLKNSGVRERPLVEVLDLSHQMADAMKSFFGSLDRFIIGEFRYIPGASMELDAVVRDTERATETIMSDSEKLMDSEPTDLELYKAEVGAAMLRIFEACSFQALTGQRVNKVIATLRHIEERVGQFADALGVKDTGQAPSASEQRAKGLLLNGPAINGPATTRDDIDAMSE